MTATTTALTRDFDLAHPTQLRLTLGPLWYGHRDRMTRLTPDRLQRAILTPEGAGTVDVSVVGHRATATAWGPGADWLLEHAPRLCGAHDDPAGFEPQHPAVERAARRLPGLRMTATGTVWDTLVPTILAQKVTGLEAARAWLRMLRRWGEPAPGPLGLTLPPAPGLLASLPTWDFHAVGVEEKRASTIRRAGVLHGALEATATMSTLDAYRRLTAVAGIGPWTAALVIRTANGDPDAVEVGDFHIKHHVCWNLAGEARGDDQRMLELLEPYRGQRGRVVRLLGAGAPRAPVFGARHALRDIREL